MSFARFIGAVQRLAGQAPAHDELLSPDRFHRVLDRERARADRTGDKLSLLAFAPRVARTDRATFCLVTKVLRGRMRVTDELGWLEDGRLAIVLPATPAAGAW